MALVTAINYGQTLAQSKLARHAERRRQGIATVSVLTGPVGSAIDIYRRFPAFKGQVVLAREPTLTAIVSSWLEYVQKCRDVQQQLVETLTKWNGPGTADVVRAIRSHDVDAVLRYIEYSVPVKKAPSKNWLARVLLPSLARGTPANCVLTPPTNDIKQLLDIASSTALLFNENELPALVAVAPSSPATPVWVASAAEALAKLAFASPQLPIAMACDTKSIKRYLAGGCDSRAKTLIAEGLIQFDAFRAQAIRDQLQEVAPTVNVRAAVKDLVEHGGSEESIRLLAELAKQVNLTDSKGERSAAERFLFDRLENNPATAGLFALNEKVPSPLGGRALEIDLCARTLGIAIEIDGYYHFQDISRYRRDRRKDFTLQQLGFFVIRCLDTDVVARLEEIFNAVEVAISIQQRKNAKITAITL